MHNQASNMEHMSDHNYVSKIPWDISLYNRCFYQFGSQWYISLKNIMYISLVLSILDNLVSSLHITSLNYRRLTQKDIKPVLVCCPARLMEADRPLSFNSATIQGSNLCNYYLAQNMFSSFNRNYYTIL